MVKIMKEELGSCQRSSCRRYESICFGIGSPEGAPIPLEGTNDYRKDKDGNVIVTRLNEQMCREIAQAGMECIFVSIIPVLHNLYYRKKLIN